MNFLKSKLSHKKDAKHWLGKTIIISGHKISIIKIIAEGGFGFVFLVKSGGKHLALKRLISSKQDPEIEEQIEKEIKFMKQLSPHENIVRFFEYTIQTLKSGEKEYHILMEYCPENLVNRINQNISQSIPEHELLNLFSQICCGVAHMHSQPSPIAHRDLKLENILIGEDGKCKLCDFGSANIGTFIADSKQMMAKIESDISRNTTLPYRAPEMVDLYSKKKICEKVDIWALGCILYKMAFFESPFENSGSLGIINAQYQFPTKSRYSKQLEGLICFLLNPDPEQRPDISVVLGKVNEIMKGNKPFEESPNRTNDKLLSPSFKEPENKKENGLTVTKFQNEKKKRHSRNISLGANEASSSVMVSRQNTAPELGSLLNKLSLTPDQQFNPTAQNSDDAFDPFGLKDSNNKQNTFNPFSSPPGLDPSSPNNNKQETKTLPNPVLINAVTKIKKGHRRTHSEQPSVHFEFSNLSHDHKNMQQTDPNVTFQISQPPKPKRGHRRCVSATVPSNDLSLL